jgi:hypothetical protein
MELGDIRPFHHGRSANYHWMELEPAAGLGGEAVLIVDQKDHDALNLLN